MKHCILKPNTFEYIVYDSTDKDILEHFFKYDVKYHISQPMILTKHGYRNVYDGDYVVKEHDRMRDFFSIYNKHDFEKLYKTID